jgi:hypothetical protein
LATVSVAILCSACGGGQATSVSKKISAAKGGTVSLGDEISLRIPAGALSADATVRVTKATKENPGPEELKSVKAVGPAWNIDLGGQELTAPVTLELTYDPSLLPQGAPEDAVFAAYYDESVGLVAIVRGRVNSDKHVIIVETTHLSWWQPSTWLSYDVTLFFERPYGCLPVDEKRDVCFEYYLHNEDGFRLDPVNLIFVGKNAAEVAKEIDQRLHWGRWCDVPVVSRIICSPLRLSVGSAVADMKDVTPAAQRKQLELTRRGYHIRLYQSPYHPDVVLASVHDDEAQCMLALDVGRDFDKARDVVARAFANEYQVESLYLGNKLPTTQCGGKMSTASNDGTVAIIRLDRPKATATPTPTATPRPAPTPTPQVTAAPSPTPARPAPTPTPRVTAAPTPTPPQAGRGPCGLEPIPSSEVLEDRLVKVVHPMGGPVEAYEVWESRYLPFNQTSTWIHICGLRLPANVYAPFDGVFTVAWDSVGAAPSVAGFENGVQAVYLFLGRGPLDYYVDMRCPAARSEEFHGIHPGVGQPYISVMLRCDEVRAGQLVAVLPRVQRPEWIAAQVRGASVDDAIRYLQLIFR